MNTSYDEIMSCFVENCGVDTSKLPTEDELLYAMINNAVKHYNVYFKHELPIYCDDTLESISVKLDDVRLLIMAYCMKYVYLENQLVGFEELWTPFQNELGIKNYRDQIKARQSTLERTRQMILELITATEDVEIM